MLIRNVLYIDSTGSCELKDVLVNQEGVIEIFNAESTPLHLVEKETDIRDAKAQFTLMRGLFDAHVHGQGGYDFAQVGEHPEFLPQIMSSLGKTGLSFAMATLISLPLPTLKKALQAIDTYIQQQSANPTPGFAQIVGIHLEGPFIAKDCKGAHDLNALQENISLAQFEEIIQCAPLVKEWKITLAPDLPGAQEFIQQVKKLNVSVKVFIGHSNPTKSDIQKAIDAGAAGFTHLGNACLETCCREARKLEAKDAKSNLVQWVLENPQKCPPGIELISDGIHLSQTFVKLVQDTVGNKIVLVSDALGPSGLADGLYKIGTSKVRKEGHAFYLADEQGDFVMKQGKDKERTLAGSGAPLSHCIHTYYQWTNTTQDNKQRMMALHAAAIENPRSSSLSPEGRAKLHENKNFALFNNEGQLVMSLCQGKLKEHLPGLSKVESSGKDKGIYTAYESLPIKEFINTESDVSLTDVQTSGLKFN